MIARALVLGALVAAGVGLGHDALADVARPLGAGPSYAELPVGRLTAPPTKKVGFVGARESVPGLFVVSQPNQGVPEAYRAVTIVADAKLARTLKGGRSSRQEEYASACVTENPGFSSHGFDGEERKAPEWTENLSSETDALVRNPENPSSGVTAVHVERLVEQSGVMTLESTDAWVDPNSRGARLIAKASLPLKLVRGPMFGVSVYAGRDERPDGKKFVQFVLVRQATIENPRVGPMWSTRPDGLITHSSGCGHARVAMAVDGESNDTATFVATAVLPDTKDAKDSATNKSDDAPSSSSPSAKQVAALSNLDRAANGMAPGTGREIRARTLHVQVSVSKTTHDKDPLVSVSATWAGREQIERSFDPTLG